MNTCFLCHINPVEAAPKLLEFNVGENGATTTIWQFEVCKSCAAKQTAPKSEYVHTCGKENPMYAMAGDGVERCLFCDARKR